MATQLNRPPLRKITDFKSKLIGGGARPNLFEVELAFPEEIAIDNDVKEKARFLVKAAALPASNITPIDVNFRGRILKIAETEPLIHGQSQLSTILTLRFVLLLRSG